MEEVFSKFNLSKSKAEKRLIIGGAILIISVLLLVLFPEIAVVSIFGILAGVIFLVIGGNEFKKINKKFKDEVLGEVVSSFVDNGVFIPNQGLSLAQVYATEFIKRGDRFHSEDYLSGSIEGVQFISSDVKVEEEHVEHTKNGTRRYYVTTFLGRVFKFDFNKPLDGYLQVLEKGRPTVNRKYNKVKLESVQFNKKFKTYSTSDHLAFYVLTPHLMEGLMDFEKNNKGHISFSFIDEFVYIGINNFKDTFELRPFVKLDMRLFEEFKKELLVVKEIIKELKLNNNLFKKER